MWSVILEKAWAKIRGNYIATFGGFNQNGIAALTNAPVFDYWIQDFGDYSYYSGDTAYEILKEADTADYIMLTQTGSGANS